VPGTRALRAALAVVFALAVAANGHSQRGGAHAHRAALGRSLILRPLITALPAFVVAFVAAALVARPTRGETAR
jgi:hypothetical protein